MHSKVSCISVHINLHIVWSACFAHDKTNLLEVLLLVNYDLISCERSGKKECHQLRSPFSLCSLPSSESVWGASFSRWNPFPFRLIFLILSMDWDLRNLKNMHNKQNILKHAQYAQYAEYANSYICIICRISRFTEYKSTYLIWMICVICFVWKI